ncbi:MAG: secondary thiamine-phosphate synthase enzyme YjbQ [Planctomycetota bacterium]
MPTLECVVRTPGRGLHEITGQVRRAVLDSGVREGLATVFIRHTSASLLIQENADPTARADLETWLDRFVPDADHPDARYTHTLEGPDDMPAHIRAAITATSLGIPVSSGEPLLGTWQGVYLWEHRSRPHTRTVLVQCMGEAG